MSMVHASKGRLKPASEHLRSEPWIVAEMAVATLPRSKIDWRGFVADYARIRDAIEDVFPAFANYNERVGRPAGFRLENAASNREWLTSSGRANFIVFDGVDVTSARPDKRAMLLTTIRSHDQYNTTVYGLNDRYRGIKGRRDVVFANEKDIAALGLKHGDAIDVVAIGEAGEDIPGRVMRGQTIVAHAIAEGSLAAYYPEANVLLSLASHDVKSGTPAYKSISVVVRPSAQKSETAAA